MAVLVRNETDWLSRIQFQIICLGPTWSVIVVICFRLMQIYAVLTLVFFLGNINYRNEGVFLWKKTCSCGKEKVFGLKIHILKKYMRNWWKLVFHFGDYLMFFTYVILRCIQFFKVIYNIKSYILSAILRHIKYKSFHSLFFSLAFRNA